MARQLYLTIGAEHRLAEDRDDLAAAADRLAASIAANPPWAVQGTLRAIWAAQDLGRLGGRTMAAAILSAAADRQAIRNGVDRFDSGERTRPRTR